MLMPCDCRIDCPGIPDSPVTNITAEAPDRLVFIGNSWGWGQNVPPLGDRYSKTSCYGTCFSTVSQQEADLCAAQLQLQCMAIPGPFPCTGDSCTSDGGGGWVDNTPEDPRPINLYQNADAFCTVACPDGNPFTFTVRAGLFTALDQISADRMAIALACQDARLNATCLSNIDTNACVNLPYFQLFTVSGGRAPFAFQIQSGTLPPGVGFFQASATTAALSGQPTTAGAYTFALRVTDSNHNFMVKSYTINVLDIVDRTQIPKPVVGTFYSYQIQITGGTAPYQFVNATGLPSGISMGQFGLISGNATVTPGTGFSVTVLDAAGASCRFDCTWETGPCSFFTGLVWSNPPTDQINPTLPNTGSSTISYPAANAVEISGTMNNIVGGQPTLCDNNGVCTKDPVVIQCTLQVQVKSATGTNFWQLNVFDNDTSALIYSSGVAAAVVGTGQVSVTIPAATIHVRMFVQLQCGNIIPGQSGSADVRWDFGV